MAKETVQEMADKLGIKKENLKLGLEKDAKAMEDAVKKAYEFKFKKR